MAIIGLSVGAYVMASVLPGAIVDLTNETLWTGAPAVVITLGTVVLGIIAVVAAILILLRSAE